MEQKIKANILLKDQAVSFLQLVGSGRVVDGDYMFLVAMTPVQLIDKSLICYGSNFQGAFKSSQQLLGKHRKKYPIKIDAALDIWLFPTKPKPCQTLASTGRKFTKVALSYGTHLKSK